MHILHQRFIKINYKFEQNKNRDFPVFIIFADKTVKCSCHTDAI